LLRHGLRLIPIKRGEWKAELIRRHARGRCLDLGCDNRLYEKDFPGEYVGLDVISWERAPDIIADAALLPFRSQTFDAVVAFDLLEHLKEPIQAVKEARRILKRGGTFLATTPHLLSPGSWLDLTHRSHWTEQQLRRILANAFQQVEIYRTGYPTLKHERIRSLAEKMGYTDTLVVLANT
jgi:SAM-dependent methyltransferase